MTEAYQDVVKRAHSEASKVERVPSDARIQDWILRELWGRIVALEAAQRHPPGDGPQDRRPG